MRSCSTRLVILSFDTATDVATACMSADGEVLAESAAAGRSVGAQRLLDDVHGLLGRAGVPLDRRRADRGRHRAGHLHGPAHRPCDRTRARLRAGRPGARRLDARRAAAPAPRSTWRASTPAAARCSAPAPGSSRRRSRPQALAAAAAGRERWWRATARCATATSWWGPRSRPTTRRCTCRTPAITPRCTTSPARPSRCYLRAPDADRALAARAAR